MDNKLGSAIEAFNKVDVKDIPEINIDNLKKKIHVLSDDKITNIDTFYVGHSRLKEIGFVNHHIESMNDFYENAKDGLVD